MDKSSMQTGTMQILRSEFLTAQEMGQLPVLIHWDPAKNQASSHPTGWQEMTDEEWRDGFNAMAVRPNSEFTFIDIDCKNTGTGSAEDLKNYILILLQEKIPYDILRKVYIEQTRSNGLHILVRYKAPEQKFVIASGPRGEELVALYRVKSLCYTYPTPGYTPVMGSRDDMEPLTRENLSLFVDVLKVLDEPKEKKAVAAVPSKPIVDRPHFWSLFDRQISDAVFMDLLDKMGLCRCDDQPRAKKDAAPYEAWRRKESASPMISAKVFFGKEPKVLLFTSSLPQFPSYHTHSKMGDWSLTASKIIYYLHEQNHEEANMVIEQLAEQDGISLDFVVTSTGSVVPKNTFWEKEKGKIKFAPDAMVQVLKEAGFYRHYDGFVRVEDNIISNVEMGEILVFLGDMAYASDPAVGRYTDESIRSYITKSNVIDRLDKLDTSKLLRDNAQGTWRFFRNCAVHVTADGAVPVSYYDLNGLIWKNHMLDRDFSPAKFDKADTYDFIKCLAGDDHVETLMAIIGYNCSRYNQPDNARLTMILEDIDEAMEGISEGGSGKSLLAHFVRHACGNQVFIDGKNSMRLMGDFAWQRVGPDTRTILVDDADRRLKIEMLYAITTGDFTVNRKNREEVVIPFEDKPKIIITSNFAIGDNNQSSNRRMFSFAVKKVFNTELQPRDKYGRLFFEGYSDQDWNEFDSMINDCIMLHLRGVLRKAQTDEKTKRRQVINNTDPEFVQYMDSLLETNFFDWAPPAFKNHRQVGPDGTVIANAVNVEQWEKSSKRSDDAICLSKTELLTRMKAMGLQHLTTKTLTKWVELWAASRGVGIDTSYKRRVRVQAGYPGAMPTDGGTEMHYRIESLPSSK